MTRQELMRELVVVHRIRSVADYAEQIVADALGGVRITNSTNKGFDVSAPGYGRVEVKFRQLPADGRLEERVALNDTKQHGFDYLCVIVFDSDFVVKGAVLVPHDAAWQFVSASPYNRISFTQACTCDGAVNITREVAAASQK